ncbi:MAG: sigma-70 family RNA polymerase sigma factor [Candidatus Didemnitutus sp.]|nr:sigma-70 family RNA polymerase sigma factor [Candidatus Didemnitutus sp.]
MPETASRSDPAPSAAAGEGAFGSTQWTVVLDSRRDSARRREALEQLCRTYWLPIYGYLRRRGYAAADAEDLTQGFFAYIIEGDFLDRPDPEKGRFRGYLIGALKHFVARHHERENTQKRGGGARVLDWTALDAEREFAVIDQPQLDPGATYERGWALALFAQALRRLEAEQTEAGHAAEFAALRPFLSSSPSQNEYAIIAEKLGVARATVAVRIFRLNRRYAEIVRLEIAASVRDPGEIEQEMRHLLAILRG